MELQRLRFLHRIWRKPSGQAIFSISIRDLTHHFRWAALFFALSGVVVLGRFYPQASSHSHTWLGCVLAPMTGSLLFLEHVFVEKIPAYIKSLGSNLHAIEGYNQLLAQTAYLDKKAAFLEQENRQLRALMALTPSTETLATAGAVVQRHRHLSSHTLVVQTSKACPLDSPVLAPEGLLGRIIEAHQSTALVLLASDVRSRIPVVVGASGVEAIAAGDGSSDLRLQYLDAHADIKEGDDVMTSGVGGVFPSGVPVGRVKRSGHGFVVVLFASGDRGRFVKILPPEDRAPSFKNIQPKSF